MKILRFNLSHPRGFGYNKAKITDEEIISALLRHDNAIIGIVYREFYPEIKKMVFTFHNTLLDPEEVFQEGFFRVYTNVCNHKFRGDSSFFTYFNSICRNICRKWLERKNRSQNDYKDIPDETDEIDFELHDRLHLVKNLLSEKCRTIIDLRYRVDGDDSGNTTPFDEVAAILKLTPENARKRFGRCLDKFREYAMKDDVLKSLYYA